MNKKTSWLSRRLQVGVLLLLPVLALSGCDNNPFSWIAEMDSDTPISGLKKPLPSPSGRFTLATDERELRVLLKDAKGTELDSLPTSRLPNLDNFTWSPDNNFFCFTSGAENKACLYVYSIQARQYRQVARSDMYDWSEDGHYLACLRQEGMPADCPTRLSSTSGAVTVLDARRRFRDCFTTRELARNLEFSPDGKHLAYEEVRRDSAGAYSIYALKVAAMATGRAVELLANQREPSYIWAGNTALAAVTYDKYAVPTLSLMHLDGKRTALVTALEFARIRPLEYEEKHNWICYAARRNAHSDLFETYWQVRPGAHPSLLPANDPAAGYCRAKAEELR